MLNKFTSRRKQKLVKMFRVLCMIIAALLISVALYEIFCYKSFLHDHPRIRFLFIAFEAFIIGDMIVELLSAVFNLYREYRTTYRWNASLSTHLYKRDTNGELEQISELVNFEFYHDIPTTYKLREIIGNYVWHIADEKKFNDVSNQDLCEWINMNTNYLAATNSKELERLQSIFMRKIVGLDDLQV